MNDYFELVGTCKIWLTFASKLNALKRLSFQFDQSLNYVFLGNSTVAQGKSQNNVLNITMCVCEN